MRDFTAPRNTPTTASDMKKKFAAASLLAATVLFGTFCLSACANRGSWQGFQKRYFFHTTADLRLFSGAEGLPSKEEAVRVAEKAEALLKDLEQSLSVTEEGSCVYAFNEAEAGETVGLDRAAYEVFSLAQQLYEETGGCYDPSVYHSVEAYGFYDFQSGGPAPETLPTQAQLSAFLQLSDFFPLIALWEEDGKYFAKKPEGAAVEIEGVRYTLKVDFGGIAKGYACDRVKELLGAFEYGYFSFSGSSMAVGKYKEDRAYYELSVLAPRENGSYLTANVQDTCLSTSADNGLYYEIGGTRYSQIIDPETMMRRPLRRLDDFPHGDGRRARQRICEDHRRDRLVRRSRRGNTDRLYQRARGKFYACGGVRRGGLHLRQIRG